MEDIITADDVLGKEAVDSDGAILGTVVKIHISSKTKQIVGITIDLGFMKPDLFVGIDYIKQFGIDTVFLNRVPSDKFKGMTVITSDGKEIGVVKEVVLFRRMIKEFNVNAKSGLFSNNEINIPASNVSQIGGSIVLKKGFKHQKAE